MTALTPEKLPSQERKRSFFHSRAPARTASPATPQLPNRAKGRDARRATRKDTRCFLLPAAYRRLGKPQKPEPELFRREAHDCVAGLDAQPLVADEAARRVPLADLELRLYERDDLTAPRQHGDYRRQYEPQRDERDVCHRKRRSLGQVLGLHEARVEVLPDPDSRIGAQPVVELVRADVHGHHELRAVLKKAVREAAGRGADVKAHAAVGDEPLASPERERALELLASSRNEARRRLYLNLRVGVDLPRRLGLRLAPDADLALHHESLSAGARGDEPALDQKHVEPLSHFVRYSILRTNLRGIG